MSIDPTHSRTVLASRTFPHLISICGLSCAFSLCYWAGAAHVCFWLGLKAFSWLAVYLRFSVYWVHFILFIELRSIGFILNAVSRNQTTSSFRFLSLYHPTSLLQFLNLFHQPLIINFQLCIHLLLLGYIFFGLSHHPLDLLNNLFFWVVLSFQLNLLNGYIAMLVDLVSS